MVKIVNILEVFSRFVHRSGFLEVGLYITFKEYPKGTSNNTVIMVNTEKQSGQIVLFRLTYYISI